jgi:hypothetical protein
MRVALVLQIAGAVLLTAGCALIAPWLGLIVGGLIITAFGVARERSDA